MATSSNVCKSWIIPDGVDPECAFKIEAKVDGFWSKADDGKKTYVKGKMLTWVVDSDRFSLCELNNDLLKELGWGRCQTAKIWILDRKDGRETGLVSESQIPQMFKMHERERVIGLHVVVGDSDGSSRCSGTNAAYSCTLTQPILGIEVGSQSQAGSTHGYVGLNEEYMYESDDEDGLHYIHSAKAIDEVDVDVQIDPDLTLSNSLHEESTVDGAVPHELIMTHDSENPKIDVGSAFPDVATFRKALKHLAILNQFEVDTIKTDKKRFIGKCKYSDCKWRIHASVVDESKACVLYPVAYGVFDLETKENWQWFMTHLRNAIGTPSGLVICSDAGKGLAAAIASIFLEFEQRECTRHLMENFKKRFHGDEVAKYMWSAARAYTTESCQFYLEKVRKLAPTAAIYLETNHKHIWCRNQFSELSKCDYETNNISESFNNWVKVFKSLHVVDLLDQIRQLIMVTFDKRRIVGSKLEGQILPNVAKALTAISRNTGKVRILRGGSDYAEVSGVDSEGTVWRNAVELDKQQCACREWQLTGKPCMHAIAFICTLRGVRLDYYVHEYYSLARFRAAYARNIPTMNDKSKWEKADIDFKVLPPLMKRPPGRPRKDRIHGCLESNKRRQRCKRCNKFGHQQRTCKEDEPEAAATKRQRYKGAQSKSVSAADNYDNA